MEKPGSGLGAAARGSAVKNETFGLYNPDAYDRNLRVPTEVIPLHDRATDLVRSTFYDWTSAATSASTALDDSEMFELWEINET